MKNDLGLTWTEKKLTPAANYNSLLQYDCTLRDDGLFTLVIRSARCEESKPDAACTYQGQYFSGGAQYPSGTSAYFGKAQYIPDASTKPLCNPDARQVFCCDDRPDTREVLLKRQGDSWSAYSYGGLDFIPVDHREDGPLSWRDQFQLTAGGFFDCNYLLQIQHTFNFNGPSAEESVYTPSEGCAADSPAYTCAYQGVYEPFNVQP